MWPAHYTCTVEPYLIYLFFSRNIDLCNYVYALTKFYLSIYNFVT